MPEYRSILKHRQRSYIFLQSLSDAKVHVRGTGSNHRLGSPFDTLPNELRIEIFNHCLSELSHFNINEGPLLISRVCRTWKYLALCTPKLWASFEIEVTGSGTNSTALYHDKYVLDTLHHWLKRSKSCPLNVRLVHIPVGRLPNDRSSQLVAALLSHARRWKNIRLVLPASDIKSLQKALPLDLPQLQSLTIKLHGNWSSNSVLNISALPVPWRQLSAIDLQLEYNNLPTLDRCLKILSQAECLRSFKLNVECILVDTHTTTDLISLPFLETLELELCDGGVVGFPITHHQAIHLADFLSLLYLPKLSNLRLGWSVKQALAWSPAHSTFITFLRSVAPTLESLSISYIPFSERQLMECLSELPGLRHLDLRFSFSALDVDPITDAFFKEFIPKDIRVSRPRPPLQPLAPLLKSLTVHCYGRQYSNPVLVEFFEARFKSQKTLGHTSSSKLHSFHLRSLIPIHPAIEDRLKIYRKDGTDVSIDTIIIG